MEIWERLHRWWDEYHSSWIDAFVHEDLYRWEDDGGAVLS